ncbi:MAG: OmpA family protein [Rhodobacteraceae bacterium]|nr:OmpA family protein [Paracoccaceae bacterium]
MTRFAAICLLLVPHMAAAFDLSLPEGAEAIAARSVADGAYRLPVGVYGDGAVPLVKVDGRVSKRTWRIVGQADKVTALARSMEKQLVAQGYEIVLACETEDCGGFDFRFAVEVLPPPDMYVDLAEYRFVGARRESADGPEAVGVLVSHTALAAMVQVIEVVPAVQAPLDLVPAPEPKTLPHLDGTATPDPAAGQLAQRLETKGTAVLSGLAFKTGASELGEGPFAVLDGLAAWLRADVARRVMLVGHTDSEGDLERNIALSQARAEAVMSALVKDYGIDKAQVSARGIGFLAPRASNATEEGREANRRVEVVVLP